MVLPVEVDGVEGPVREALGRLAGVRVRLVEDVDGPAALIGFEAGACPVEQVAEAVERAGGRALVDRARYVQPGGVEVRVSAPRRERARGRVIAMVARSWAMRLVALGGLALVAGVALKWSDAAMWAWLPLMAVSAAVTSTRTFPEALESVRSLRVNVDVLMFVAAAGAASLGHWEEGAFLLFLFGLGAAGEHLALEHAERSVESLARMAPDTAEVERGGRTTHVKVEEVAVGEMIVVRPFDRVPMDCQVVEGRTAVDESMITGESVPVEKTEGSRLLAGTMNAGGMVRARVVNAAGESTLARIMKLVAEAQASRSPAELFTERVERVYVPMVFVMTTAVLAAPPLLTGGEWGLWFYRAMGFMTAASPCALAIGTPAAVLCALGRAAQLGVLIKGGGHLETLARVRVVGLDKTGTLTAGRPQVTAIAPAAGMEEGDVLALAAAVESRVTHPLAEAVERAARGRGLAIAEATGVGQETGAGAFGTVGGRRVRVVRPDAASQWSGDLLQHAEAWRRDGATVAAVEVDGRVVGVLRLEDEARQTARGAIDRLRAMGIERIAMLTGDHEAAAMRVARVVGIDEVYAGLRPDEKLQLIDGMKVGGAVVAMVGDGVNDAPALAQASIGVAMGAAGADAAMETADVALMGSRLEKLPEAMALARAARRMIGQNLVIALGVIAVVAPAAALGHASLGVAVLLHEGSTVVVVLNALRLLRWRP